VEDVAGLVHVFGVELSGNRWHLQRVSGVERGWKEGIGGGWRSD